MKKIIKSRLFLVIITMIVCISGTLYATNKYYSNEIVYNTSDGKTMNVGEALDNLYSDYNSLKKKGNATANQILNGKTAIVNGNEITGKMNNLSDTFIWVNADNGKFDTNVNYTYLDGSKTSNALVFHSNNNGYMNNNTNFIFGKSDEIANMIKSGAQFLGVTGAYTKDATATSGDILSGKTAYVNGQKITGTLSSASNGTLKQLYYSGGTNGGATTYTLDADYKQLLVLSVGGEPNIGKSPFSSVSTTCKNVVSSKSYRAPSSDRGEMINILVINNAKKGDTITMSSGYYTIKLVFSIE